MPKCAYCGKEVDFDGKKISYCRDGCHNTLFQCKCGSSNRTTAIYCRSCGKNVSYNELENQSPRLQGDSSVILNDPLFDLSLSELGINQPEDLPKLYFAYGYLFLIFKNGRFLILNCFKGDAVKEIELSKKHLLTLPINVSDKRSKSLFFFCENDVYRLDLIRDFDHELIINAEENGFIIDHQPLYIDRYFFLSFWNNVENVTLIKLISLDGEHKEIIRVNERISQPIRIKNKILFYTQNNLFIYSHDNQNISSKTNNHFGFDVNSKPQSDNLRAFILNNDDRLYRINLDGNEPEIFGLSHLPLLQANFDVSSDRVFIVHNSGIIVTNMLGQVEWSSDELLSPYPAYKFPPISFGNYFAFVMNYPNTEVLHIIKRPEYKQIVSLLGNYLSKPEFYAGNIYVIVYEGDIIKLRAYSL